MEQTLHCTRFTNPTWPSITCRCGSLIHNELIMVLLVQDCFAFLPRTHIDGANLRGRCGRPREDIAPGMKHTLWNVLLLDSRLWVSQRDSLVANGRESFNNTALFYMWYVWFKLSTSFHEGLRLYLRQMKLHDTEHQLNYALFMMVHWYKGELKDWGHEMKSNKRRRSKGVN